MGRIAWHGLPFPTFHVGVLPLFHRAFDMENPPVLHGVPPLTGNNFWDYFFFFCTFFKVFLFPVGCFCRIPFFYSYFFLSIKELTQVDDMRSLQVFPSVNSHDFSFLLLYDLVITSFAKELWQPSKTGIPVVLEGFSADRTANDTEQ